MQVSVQISLNKLIRVEKEVWGDKKICVNILIKGLSQNMMEKYSLFIIYMHTCALHLKKFLTKGMQN